MVEENVTQKSVRVYEGPRDPSLPAMDYEHWFLCAFCNTQKVLAVTKQVEVKIEGEGQGRRKSYKEPGDGRNVWMCYQCIEEKKTVTIDKREELTPEYINILYAPLPTTELEKEQIKKYQQDRNQDAMMQQYEAEKWGGWTP